MFHMVVCWHKLGEVVSVCTVHNNTVLAIFLPKIIKVGGNFTKLRQKHGVQRTSKKTSHFVISIYSLKINKFSKYFHKEF